MINQLLSVFTRTKHLKPSDFKTTPFNRCLSTMDLTALAISSTIGSGIYVLTGEVIRLKAGPSVILSFIIAALASLLCGVCYAEFGARFPKAGSAYIYSYVTVGEVCAFVIGWNLILEYIVGTAATARVWGSFFDALLNNRIQNSIESAIGTINFPLLAKYPDFLSFAAVVGTVMVVALGVRQSVAFNWFFLALNVVVILFVTITGLFFADVKNWSDFFPFGLRGMMAGSAILFYSFVGFDVVGSCGEEARTPGKSIPRAIIGCLVFSLFAYLGVAITLSLIVPYYKLTEYSSIANAFQQRGFPVGKYFVALGATCALLSGLVGQIFPLPRIMYAMAADGLIFGFLGRINERTGTPVVATVVGGVLTALLTLLLDLISLVEMLSIGTLLAYTIVALCVLLLRYRPGDAGIQIDPSEDEEEESSDDEMTIVDKSKRQAKERYIDVERSIADEKPGGNRDIGEGNGYLEKQKDKSPNDKESHGRLGSLFERLMGWEKIEPTEDTYSVVKLASAAFIVLSITLESCLIYGLDSFTSFKSIFCAVGLVLVLSILFVVYVIARQPQSRNDLVFKVPLVPLVPLLSVFMNIYLILMLSFYTWIRFSVWMTIGMAIYLFYGVRHSKQNPYSGKRKKSEEEYKKLSETDNEEPHSDNLDYSQVYAFNQDQ